MLYVFLGLALVFVFFVAYAILKKGDEGEVDEVLEEDQDSDVFSHPFSSGMAPETTVAIPQVTETPLPVKETVKEKPVVKKKAAPKKTATSKQKPDA